MVRLSSAVKPIGPRYPRDMQQIAVLPQISEFEFRQTVLLKPHIYHRGPLNAGPR